MNPLINAAYVRCFRRISSRCYASTIKKRFVFEDRCNRIKWQDVRSIRYMHATNVLYKRSSSHEHRKVQKIYDKSQVRSDIPLKPLHEVLNLSEFLIEEIAMNIEHNMDVTTMKNQLTNLLFQLYIQNSIEFLNVFEKMRSFKACTEASYIIVMKYFVGLGDYGNVRKYFDLLKNDVEIKEIHARAYVPLINVCLRSKNYHLIPQYYAELSNLVKIKFQDQIFVDVINTCTELLCEENEKNIRDVMKNILLLFEMYGSTELHRETLKALTRWFESDPLVNWSVEKTTMRKSSVKCKVCRKDLTSSVIPQDRLTKLKRSLVVLIKGSIIHKQEARISDVKVERVSDNIKTKVHGSSDYFEFYDALTMSPRNKEKTTDDNTVEDLKTLSDSFDVLKNLRKFLNEAGPFDVVIDALNVGYFSQGFDPVAVRQVVDFFLDKKQKVLILCAGILKEEFLHKAEVAPANTRIQNLMLYLEKNCFLYNVKSSVVDDYYILYTLVHQNFNINLVSRDLFRDHLYHLDAQNSADFKRWQRSNQYMIKTFQKDGSPIFKARFNHAHAVQRHRTGWHIPVDQTLWLCVRDAAIT